MSTSDLAVAVEALSCRMMAIEMLLFALVDTSPDQAAVRKGFDLHAAGLEARINASPLPDQQIEPLRQSADMHAAVR